jgi:hypothetical protein
MTCTYDVFLKSSVKITFVSTLNVTPLAGDSSDNNYYKKSEYFTAMKMLNMVFWVVIITTASHPHLPV